MAKGKAKGRNIAIVLYPDNRYHMEYLEYLQQYSKGFFINHTAESDEKKDHIHCVIIFPNARSENGYLKSLPTVKYAVSHEGEILSCFPTDSDITDDRPLLSHAEVISDLNAYSVYLLHEDYKSMKLGKKRYCENDVINFGTSDNLFSAFYKEDKLSDMEIIKLLLSFNATSKKQLLEKVVELGNHQVFKYLQTHGYFVNEFLMKG